MAVDWERLRDQAERLKDSVRLLPPFSTQGEDPVVGLSRRISLPPEVVLEMIEEHAAVVAQRDRLALRLVTLPDAVVNEALDRLVITSDYKGREWKTAELRRIIFDALREFGVLPAPDSYQEPST